MPKATPAHNTRSTTAPAPNPASPAPIGHGAEPQPQAPAALAQGAHPDAELIRNCMTLIRLEAEWRSLASRDGDMPGCHGYYELLDLVTATPALTDDGNRAKLAVAVSFYDPDPPDDGIVDPMMWDAVLALALPAAPWPRVCSDFTLALPARVFPADGEASS